MTTASPPVQFAGLTQASAADLDADITNAGTGGVWMYGGPAGGTANAVTITVPNSISAFVDGQVFRFIAASNNTSAATLTVTPQGSPAIGTLPLCDQDGNPLSAGLIVAGRIYEFYVTTVSGVTKLRWPQVTTAATAFTTGDIKLTWKAVADSGWIIATDGTIGSAASGATTRANADTLDLYTLIWTNIGASGAPIFTSGGSPTTYGASAAADFTSNKQLRTGTVASRALASAGAGIGLTVRTLGTVFGEEKHVLTVAELPPIPILSVARAIDGTGSEGDYTLRHTADGGATNTTFTPDNTSAGHNTMGPTTFMNVMVKL